MKIDANDKLDVFVSSDIVEFKRKRKRLSVMINKMPVLKCHLLEDRGAASDNVRNSSLEAAEACDIYVGIFGKEYSEITILECRTAINKRKRYLVYVQTTKKSRRDPELDNFIKTELKFLAKYHPFKSCRELEKQIMKDLGQQVGKILRAGSKALSEVKDEAMNIEQNVKTELTRPSPPSENKVKSLLSKAEDHFRSGDYLSALITANIYLEKVLRYSLVRMTDRDYTHKPFHLLIRDASKLGLIDRHFVDSLLLYRNIRNNAVHDGITPTPQDVQTVLKITKQIAGKLHSLTEDFHAEIIEKREYQVRERLKFRVRFRGYLRSGFLDAYILGPNNISAWSWDRETLINDLPSTPGNLRGPVEFDKTWDWIIPADFPSGQYHAYIRVYDHLDSNERIIVAEKKVKFYVVDRDSGRPD